MSSSSSLFPWNISNVPINHFRPPSTAPASAGAEHPVGARNGHVARAQAHPRPCDPQEAARRVLCRASPSTGRDGPPPPHHAGRGSTEGRLRCVRAPSPPQARPPGPSRGRRQAAAPLPMRSRLQPRGRAGAARSARDRRQGLQRLSARVQQQGSPGGRDATCGGSGRSSGARTATGAPLRIARLHRSGERRLCALGPVLAPLTAGGGGGGRQETGLPSWPCCGPGPPSRERSFAACTPLYAVDRLVRWPVGGARQQAHDLNIGGRSDIQPPLPQAVAQAPIVHPSELFRPPPWRNPNPSSPTSSTPGAPVGRLISPVSAGATAAFATQKLQFSRRWRSCSPVSAGSTAAFAALTRLVVRLALRPGFPEPRARAQARESRTWPAPLPVAPPRTRRPPRSPTSARRRSQSAIAGTPHAKPAVTAAPHRHSPASRFARFLAFPTRHAGRRHSQSASSKSPTFTASRTDACPRSGHSPFRLQRPAHSSQTRHSEEHSHVQAQPGNHRDRNRRAHVGRAGLLRAQRSTGGSRSHPDGDSRRPRSHTRRGARRPRRCTGRP